MSTSAETSRSHWAPHGAALTACLVGVNVFMILLIFFYFWRFFSGKRGPSVDDDDEAAASSSGSSSPANSPRASGRLRQQDVESGLPVSVYDGKAAAAAADCAVCIVEFRDGDMARRLPRCGHRFHAACVDAWLRRHATCPLCRGSVVAPSFPSAGAKNETGKDGGGGDGA